MVKNLPANAGDVGSIPGWEDPLKEEMATHCSILAWRTPWTEEPSGATAHGVAELGMTWRLNNKALRFSGHGQQAARPPSRALLSSKGPSGH